MLPKVLTIMSDPLFTDCHLFGPNNARVRSTGDSLDHHRDMPFSTWDNDNSKKNCPKSRHGAWWYNDCMYSNLNGLYKKGISWSYVIWGNWLGRQSLRATEMKMRPMNFHVGMSYIYLLFIDLLLCFLLCLPSCPLLFLHMICVSSCMSCVCPI